MLEPWIIEQIRKREQSSSGDMNVSRSCRFRIIRRRGIAATRSAMIVTSQVGIVGS